MSLGDELKKSAFPVIIPALSLPTFGYMAFLVVFRIETLPKPVYILHKLLDDFSVGIAFIIPPITIFLAGTLPVLTVEAFCGKIFPHPFAVLLVLAVLSIGGYATCGLPYKSTMEIVLSELRKASSAIFFTLYLYTMVFSYSVNVHHNYEAASRAVLHWYTSFRTCSPQV